MINWSEVQTYYDSGKTYRDITSHFGIANKTIVTAAKKGLFIARTKTNRSSKYNWIEIQQQYDNGSSWRKLREEFGIAFLTLQRAVKRGDLVSRSLSESGKLTYLQGRIPAEMSVSARKQISEEQSLRNRGGRCKWYEVSGQKVQGTWERDGGLKLSELGITWFKVTKKTDVLWYELDGKQKAYTPDFYLPEYDVFLEFKGYWWGRDKEKMKAVIEQHPTTKIIIVEKELFQQLLKGDKIWFENDLIAKERDLGIRTDS